MLAKCGNNIFSLDISPNVIDTFSERPDIDQERIFDPETSCMDDEWLYIQLDDAHYHLMIEDYNDAIRNSASYNTLQRESFGQVSVLFGSTDREDYISFQKITNKKQIERKNFLIFERGTTVRTVENAIELSDEIDAFFVFSNCRLYFKSFRRINSMFPGIEDYYRLANEEDYNLVMNNASIVHNLCITNITKRNLHLIALLVHESSVNLNNQETVTQMIEHSHEFSGINLNLNENNQFVLANNSDLNNFLKLALGRYYFNPITAERMEADSARRL